MGQILIIHGEDQAKVSALYSAGLRLYQSLCHLRPMDGLLMGQTAVAKLPRLLAATAGIHRGQDGQAWICGAGTYFYCGHTAPGCFDSLLAVLPRHDGSDCKALADIDGIFTLASGSCAGDELSIVTDRLGSLHIFFATVDSCLLFCTSSMVLAALLRPRWDLLACREFLATGTIFEQRSLFEGIEKLEPATLYRFRRGRLQSKVLYADLAQFMYDRSSMRGDVPQLAAALEDSIFTIGKNFSNPVCDLTGGFDSRAIVGAMLRSGFNFQTVVNGAPDLPDVLISRRIAEELGLRHMHQPSRITSPAELWEGAKASLPLCDGEYEVLLYASVHAIHSRLAGQFEATVNGSNGEICKGYWWELLFPFIGRRDHFNEQLVAAKRFAFEREPELLDWSFPNNLVEHFADVIRRANRRLQQHPNTAQMDNVYLTLRMQRWQGRIASATSRIWPCISPFTWHKPLEVALSSPPRVRVRNRMARRLIEHFNPRLAAIPLAQGYPALPLRLNTAHLFWPLAAEMARKATQRIASKLPSRRPPGPLPSSLHTQLWQLEEVRELLNNLTMQTRDLFRPRELKSIVNPRNGHSSASSSVLGRILTLELLASAIHSSSRH